MFKPIAALALGMAAAFGATAGTAQQPPAAAPTARELPDILIIRTLPPRRDRLIRTVFIGDLDLATAAGRQEMEKRVGKAVDDMCEVPTPLPSYGDRMAKPCSDEAWSGARPQMAAAVQRANGS